MGIGYGSVVLDVGFGRTSELLEISRVVGADGIVYGIETRKDIVAKALEELGDASNIRPLLGQADRVPLPDGSVDFIVFKGILHEISDIPRVLLEAKRVCKIDGAVVVVDFTPFPVSWLRSSNRKWRFKNPTEIFSGSVDRHPGFSKADLSTVFARAGFSLIRYEDAGLEGGFAGRRVSMFLAEARKLSP